MDKSKINIIIPIVALLIGGLVSFLIWGNNQHVNTSNNQHIHESNNQSIGKEEIWTCSMHPQIRQNEPGLCPICEMDLIPLDNSLSNDDPTILRMSKEAAKLAQIETFIVGDKDSNDQMSSANIPIKVDGTIELDERTFKSQTAHLSGRIETMAISFEGQYINKGMQIATLYSTDLLAASQELITAVQYNDRVDGLKDAAIQKLKNWKITDAQIQQIVSTNKPIETIPIFADHSGFVMSKKISQGDYVRQGQSMYTLGSTSRVWLVFNVFESDLSNVKVGNEVKFTTPSIANKEFTTKVTYIDPLLNSSSRTALVRAEINNKNNILKPGMLLTGMIATSMSKSKNRKTTQVIIPNSAVLWTGKRSVVYVQLPDSEVPSYEFREVEISNRSGGFSTVISGIEQGDEIVSQGAFSIDAAAQLNNNMSMMNRKVKVKNNDESETIPSFSENTSDEFKTQLDKTIVAYINLKDALVQTDPNQASLEADMFIKSLMKVDMTLLENDGHNFWMEQLNALKAHGEKMKNANDIEIQRSQFDFLSQAMIKSIKAFGTNDKTYYVQYCPMANDNQGADWISTEDQIRNPYFGDKMMKCGSVKLELK